jgi:hypothetical protein
MKREDTGSRPVPARRIQRVPQAARPLTPKDRYDLFLEKLDTTRLELYESMRAALASSDELRRDVKDLKRRVDFIEESLAAIGTRKKSDQPRRSALVISRKRGAR